MASLFKVLLLSKLSYNHAAIESCLCTDTAVLRYVAEVTIDSVSDIGMSSAGLMFEFEEGLGEDFGDAEWDLTMPSRTASIDNNSDIENLPLSTDPIVVPLNINVVLLLPSTKHSWSDTISVPNYVG